eukprot:SAG22_NODE_228_length_14619_cov_4.604132_7_plen_1008_part_00
MLPCLSAAVAIAAAAAAAAAPAYNPTADPAATVLCDSKTRLTVLTSKVVRAERVPEGTRGQPFEDRATIAFINRKLPVPEFTVQNTSEWCNVTIADGMTVVLRKGSGGGAPAPAPGPPPAESACDSAQPGRDAVCAAEGKCGRAGPVLYGLSKAGCCAACDNSITACGSWVYDAGKSGGGPGGGQAGAAPESQGSSCFLLTRGTVVGTKAASSSKTFGGEVGGGPPPPPHAGLRAAGVLQAMSSTWAWRAWEPEPLNLLGTLQGTDDGVSSADLAGCCTNPNATAGEYDTKPPYVLRPGLVSRAGCTAVDDSAAALLDMGSDGDLDESWLSNITSAPAVAGREDLYIFGCGTDYRGCLADFVKVAGPMALPAHSALGVWWSRHWGNPHNIPWGKEYFGPMTEDNILTKVVGPYEEKGLPLHVLVMDMEWHEMFQSPCYTSGPGAWGGYSWNKTLFADPAAFVAKLHASRGPLGIKVAVNTHPDRGVDACQDHYAEMAAAIGASAVAAGNKTLTDLNQACAVETKSSNPDSCTRQYVDAYFKYMIDPIGADYQWTDSPSVTTFTNELYVRYPSTKKKRRGVNFSRYGGLGNHRTPVGFSGDTLRKWDTLAYQAYFTARAANVGFGWWSHDIGGFSGSPVDDLFHTEGPELHLRWLQFGAFAPIFRCHCRYCEQRAWTWGPGWFELMRRPMLLRNQLLPYIYTHAATKSFGSGEALLTPTYWDPAASASEEAYAPEYGQQFFFGREMLVAPVSEPLPGLPSGLPDNNRTTWDSANRKTVRRSVWLPPGQWVSWGGGGAAVPPPAAGGGAVFHGPQAVTAEYGLRDTPLFVRAGAVIPSRTMASAYKTTADPLVWLIATGLASGNGSAYEDDGDSLGYRQGEGATTNLRYNVSEVGSGSQKTATVHYTVSPTTGKFAGVAERRGQWVAVHGFAKLPATASCNGVVLQPSPSQTAPGWWIQEGHDAALPSAKSDSELIVAQASVVIACPPAPVTAGLAIAVSWHVTGGELI